MQRRHFLAAATALSLAAFAALALAQEFPVTVEHLFGTTTVPAKPLRVVSIGYHEQDFLYALDVAPVGVKSWIGDYPYATLPWAEAKRVALNATPEVMPGDDVNLEWVVAQDPDLIVGIYMPMDENLYAQLSKIAPVIASPKGFLLWGAPWQEELRIIDRAVSGSTAKSDAIIADIDAQIAAQRAKFPELAGKTGTNVYYEEGSFTLWSSNDLASRFLIDLGLTFPPELEAMADADNRITVSAENLRLIDMDVTIWPIGASDTTTKSAVEAMPLYQNLNLAKEGRSVWLDDGKGVAYAAMSFQSPLSVGYLIETLPPLLAAATDGDPATVVPSLK